MTPTYRGANFIPAPASRASSTPLVVAGAMMLLSLAATYLVLFESEDLASKIERPYLIPWVLATGALISGSMVYLKRKGEFTFINPVVFPTLVYFFPVYFFGGWSLIFGWSDYHYLNYVTDPEWNFPLAFVYTMLGFGGLVAGFLLPVGKRVGNFIGGNLPSWEFTTKQLIIFGGLGIPIGMYLLISSISLGTSGYQGNEGPDAQSIGSFSLYLTIVFSTSSLLLWLAFFRLGDWGVPKLAILAILIPTNLFFALSAGNRGGLFGVFITFLCGFALSKRELVTRQWVLIAGASVLMVFVGMIYGNAFRAQKGSVNTVSTEQYYQTAFDAFSSIGEVDLGTQVEFSVRSLFQRLEIASSLAVVVSNHEALARYEASYGLENNIWQYTWTSLIPRVVWKDKPMIADSASYNDLYFDSRWSGFSVTAMGDLLRNFGPLGVPLGMLLIGFLLRIFYSALIDGAAVTSWKGTLLCIVVTRIGYEGFYGQILPDAIRISVVVMGQILLMRLLVILFTRNRR